MIYDLSGLFVFDASKCLVTSLTTGEAVDLEPQASEVLHEIVRIRIEDGDKGSSIKDRILAAVWPVEYADKKRDIRPQEKKLATYGWTLRKVLPDGTGASLVATTTYRLLCDAKPVEVDHQEQRTGPGTITEGRCPFPGVPYRFGSDEFSDVFISRDIKALKIKELIDSRRSVLLVTGPSGAGKTSLLSKGLKKFLPEKDYFYAGPIAVGSGMDPAEGTLSLQLLHRLYNQLKPKGLGAVITPTGINEVFEMVAAGIEASEEPHFVFCFDQMENFFRGSLSGQLRTMLRRMHELRDHVRDKGARITFILVFRKEALFDMDYHVREVFSTDFLRTDVWNFSRQEAKDSLVKPFLRRGISFPENLAEQLLEALAGSQGDEIKPGAVQIVGRKLWLDAAKLTGDGQSPRSEIDQSLLTQLAASDPTGDMGLASNEPPQTDAARFVAQALADSVGKSIINTASKTAESVDHITLCLVRRFVGTDGARLRVKKSDDNRFVGELPMPAIEGLVDEGLLQLSADDEYEISHDSLATRIEELGNASPHVFAMRSLDLERSRRHAGFTQNAELLRRLDVVRCDNGSFGVDEAEYVLRCGLGTRAHGSDAAAPSLESWALLVANESFHEIFVAGQRKRPSASLLADVLLEGLTCGLEAVQRDVVELLGRSRIREELKDELTRFEGAFVSICLNGETDVLKARAGAAMLAFGYAEGIEQIVRAGLPSESEDSGAARLALALIRNATDGPEPLPDFWVKRWKSLDKRVRAGTIVRLFRWRIRDARSAGTFIIATVMAFTAVGAAMPFLLLGSYFALSLVSPPGANPMMASVQGAAGGMVWGCGVSLAFLLYFRIWKGGWVGKGPANSIPAFLWTAIGGALSGIVNAVIISYVFQPDTLVRAGWMNASTLGRGSEVWGVTMHGWAMVILGAALGGVGWSLAEIVSSDNWFDCETISRGMIRTSSRRICAQIKRTSLRNVFCLSLAAFPVAFMVQPGEGVCEPAAHVSHVDRRKYPGDIRVNAYIIPEGCTTIAGRSPIRVLSQPNRYLRTTGLAVIMLIGSLFLEAGFLFSLLTVRFGLDITQRLRKPYFLWGKG